jgi:hypothetical protein
MAALTIASGINIGPGITITSEPNLKLSLDAATYSGSGNWIDSVAGLNFTLNNSPTWSSSVGGGSFNFAAASSQWANSATSLASLSTWTVEVWHYYTGIRAGTDLGGVGACLVTETYTGTPNAINYSLGNDNPASGANLLDLQSGFWNGTWNVTPANYQLTANNWYQIVGTYNGSTVKLYVNNVLAQSASVSGTPSSSGLGIRLMRRWDNADYWDGRLAIVKIYDGDIGASGVAGNWNANKSRFGL